LGLGESLSSALARVLRLLLVAGHGGPHGGDGRVAS
jgi:hypothetical protein